MDKQRIAVLVIVPACIFLIITATSMLVMSANLPPAAPPTTIYTLRAWEERVGLFAGDNKAPIAQYDIYLALLPPQDAQRLRTGIRAATKAEAMHLLEDLGY